MAVRRAIVAFPSGGATAVAESIRHRFDPLSELIPAHITLVFPFESELETDKLRAHVTVAVATIESFEVDFVGASIAEGEYVFANIGLGSRQLVELHERLYGGPLLDYRTDRAYMPHMTVAHTTDQKRLRKALAAASRPEMKFSARVDALTAYEIAPGARRNVEFQVRLTS